MKGNVFYQGNRFWDVEGMGTDSLPTVFRSAIAIRGTEQDAKSFRLLACSAKYETLDTAWKVATLEKYFDASKLFGSFDKESLPTKYLETYADYKKAMK
jgi:hypothetical protein